MTQKKDIFNYAHEIKHNLLLLACFLKTFILVHLVICMSNFTLFFDFQIVCKVYLHKSLLPKRALLPGRSSTEFLSDRLCFPLCPLLRSSFVARKPLNKSAPCELLTGSGDVTVRESAFNVIQNRIKYCYIYIYIYIYISGDVTVCESAFNKVFWITFLFWITLNAEWFTHGDVTWSSQQLTWRFVYMYIYIYIYYIYIAHILQYTLLIYTGLYMAYTYLL